MTDTSIKWQHCGASQLEMLVTQGPCSGDPTATEPGEIRS